MTGRAWLAAIVALLALVTTAHGQTVTVAWDRAPACTLATDCPPLPTHFYVYRDLTLIGTLPVPFDALPGELLQWIATATAAVHWFGVSAVNTYLLDGTGQPVESAIVQVQWCVDGSCGTEPPPPPPAESCGSTGYGDGLDNDGDGQVDEGCAVPLPPPPPAPTCTLNGITYQVGERTTVQLKPSQVSEWIGLHPEWQFISSTPKNRAQTIVTVECQP